jgi:leader peptidase (prepilin peptidase)/N-methyltransferase
MEHTMDRHEDRHEDRHVDHEPGGGGSAVAELAPPSMRLRVPPAVSVSAIIIGWAASFVAVGSTAALVAFVALTVALVQLSVIDLAEHRLPNRLTLRAALVGAVTLPLASLAPIEGISLSRAVAGAAVSLVVHLAVHVASPGGFGMGDVKLAPTIGAHLAFLSWDAFTWGLLWSFAACAGVALGLLVTGRAGRRTKIAFGPFMAFGAIAALFLHGLAG